MTSSDSGPTRDQRVSGRDGAERVRQRVAEERHRRLPARQEGAGRRRTRERTGRADCDHEHEPESDAGGWTAQVREINSTSVTWLTVYALCAKVAG